MKPMMTTIPDEEMECKTSALWNEALEPEAKWLKDFDVWISQLSAFRKIEREKFLLDTQNPELRCVHRGFASNLIAVGEKLMLRAIRQNAANASTAALQAFLANLQESIATWHTATEEFATAA